MNEPRPASGRSAAAPTASAFLRDVLAGLAAPVKSVPPKYFYDEAGSRLFDRICELPEYYVTRTEMAILEAYAGDIATALGPDVLLIEPGSGSSAKVGRVLERLETPAGYVPVEISGEHMLANLAPLRARFPALEILPVCADFTAPFQVPASRRTPRRRVVFFPGSTLGNFPPDSAVELLRIFHGIAGPDGVLLLGADLAKAPSVLEPAYDDSAGVTAAFNRNLLHRMRRELDAELDPDGFRHRAVWNAEESRIEMHLVSLRPQSIGVGGERFQLAEGEPIVTEYSYKHTLADLEALADRAGFGPDRVWTDERAWFGVLALARR